MNRRDDRASDYHDRAADNSSPLSLSLLTSESVYKLVLLVEYLLRWLGKNVARPCMLQLRCLLW